MATSTATPSMNQVAMVVLWIETLLYGINCVMYGLCMSVLLRRGKDLQASTNWVLPSMSTVLFIFCTIHIGASLQQLLDAFVYAPVGVPNYSTAYWLNPHLPPRIVKDVAYSVLLLAHHVLQVWRLYVVFIHDWRVIVVPIMLLVGGAGSTYASIAISALSNLPYTPIKAPLGITAFSLLTSQNIIVTLAIVTRLWWVGRRTASLTGTPNNRFASSIYIVIESGAISVLFCAIFLALMIYGRPVMWIGIDVLAQLDGLVPFLLALQISHYRSRGTSIGSSSIAAFAHDRIIFQPGGANSSRDTDDTIAYQMPVDEVQV